MGVEPAPDLNPPPGVQSDRQAAVRPIGRTVAGAGYLHGHPALGRLGFTRGLPLPLPVTLQRHYAQTPAPAELLATQPTSREFCGQLRGLGPTSAPPPLRNLLLFVHPPTQPWNPSPEQLGCSDAYGQIAVSGWALDNYGVSKVEIWRDKVAIDPPAAVNPVTNLVYIGIAYFVPAARPDIQVAYPDLPNADRAGWGYMMLTHGLPNGGNGTFKIHAIATDGAGNTFELTSAKTITCTNATSIKPFGTIDSPSPGGIVSGTAFNNSGWALTPGTAMIPVDGSTIFVYLNTNILLGRITSYGGYRDDLHNKLPGYTNTDTAAGAFAFDTTQWPDDFYRMAWSVTDNQGRNDGVGSRWFEINNDTLNTFGVIGAQPPTRTAGYISPRVFPIRPEGSPAVLKSTDGQVYLRRSGPDATLEVLPRDFSGG